MWAAFEKTILKPLQRASRDELNWEGGGDGKSEEEVEMVDGWISKLIFFVVKNGLCGERKFGKFSSVEPSR